MPPVLRDLANVSGYDQNSQKIVGFMARQLDEHLAKLKRVTEGLTVEQLEWQIHPGHNTIGMLLAHCAVAEAYWVAVFDSGKLLPEEGDQVIKSIIGIFMDDDGMPAKAGSKHPETIKGKSLIEYYAMLDNCRHATHNILRAWSDEKLASTLVRGEKETSFGWVVYHIHEHLVEHCGQIQYIKHLMRDAGVLPPLPTA